MSPPIGFSWEPFSLDEMPMAWVRPERGHDRSKVILYCHGGGYTSGNLGYARVLAAKWPVPRAARFWPSSTG